MKHKWLLCVLFLASLHRLAFAEIPYIISERSPSIIEGRYLGIYEDVDGVWDATSILKEAGKFTPFQGRVPNLQYSTSTYWLKLEIINGTNEKLLAIELSNPQLDSVEAFFIRNNEWLSFKTGDALPFSQRLFQHQHFIFPFELDSGENCILLLKVKSMEQVNIPLLAGRRKDILTNNYQTDLIAGIYFGIMFVMFFYNLFLFLSIRDKSYLYYITYIAGIALAQAALQGYVFKYVLFDWPYLNQLSVVIFSAVSGVGAIQFVRTFLPIKSKLPLIDKGLKLFAIVYVLALIIYLLGWRQLSYNFLDALALTLSFYALYFSIRLSIQGERSAMFFLFAWSIFMIGMFVFVSRNLGWLPFNFLTKNALIIGSAIEAVLLSVALADRINILKKEKETSQALALQVSLENEKLVREQNLVLEAKVAERTEALQKTNYELENTLDDLKNTQTQLVNSEKMASLGQLTAGIAHEINNPINFVTSNIVPLRRDMDDLMTLLNAYGELHVAGVDYQAQLAKIKKLERELDFEFLKEEINILLNGMEEGAKRTAEIVKGLRIFSRLDESDLKKVDINEGIESTLILLNSSMGGKIDLVKNYDPDAFVECYPGKMNQVIMNITNNAIQAILENESPLQRGVVEITTQSEQDHVRISIRDNGPGMTSETKEKIFDPFFTTKQVGHGTGLGLSIVYSIIEAHNGKIDVESTPKVGTTFHILLPKQHTK
ncbi:MAG: hypothetical protein C0424_09725 [Sphingobacteriaceae bacterium]|nr:hypothetical protein [Sphingobacteriaceae bacterium]